MNAHQGGGEEDFCEARKLVGTNLSVWHVAFKHVACVRSLTHPPPGLPMPPTDIVHDKALSLPEDEPSRV